MRILVWHGWLLDGTGSNVYTARTVEAWRKAGHEVLLLCQDRHPERFTFVDEVASSRGEPGSQRALRAQPSAGRVTVLRPEIGEVLPVFVWDEYEGFRVTTFVDLTTAELDAYLDANVAAMREAADRHRPDLAVIGHAIPGPAIARRALGRVPYVAKIHGSDLEYAVRRQDRYVDLAREGLEAAIAIAGSSRDVNDRLLELVPSVADRLHVVAPGVASHRFRPALRRTALLRAAARLEADPDRRRGRPSVIGEETGKALRRRDAAALDALAGRYEQSAPDPDAPECLRGHAEGAEPLIGYLGKLIPQKGVHLLVGALALLPRRPRAIVVGYGTFREWLEALVLALDAGDAEGVRFLCERGGMEVDLDEEEVRAAAGLARDVNFTGVLDHRYAPGVMAAVDVLVVPSILDEAFGMVALEGAAAGALPLVARHSGLAEIASALEGELGEPGLLSFDPGPRASREIAKGLERLLRIPEPDRRSIGRRLSAFVAERWGWDRTAESLLRAAGAAS